MKWKNSRKITRRDYRERKKGLSETMRHCGNEQENDMSMERMRSRRQWRDFNTHFV
jgi:hypothetical protein